MSDSETLTKPEEKPHYHGHRQRLRERLLKSKLGSLPDYEILELLLFPSHPRGDVKPLAKMLISQFGSFAKVITTDPEVLKKVPGVTDSVITMLRMVQESAVRLIKDDITTQPILQSWKALLDYCRATMGHLNTEQFRILYLNKQHMLIADELQEVGTIDRAAVYPREVVKRALVLEAAAIILVHNHPGGNTKPSKADIDITKQIMQAASVIGVELHDHLVVSSSSHYSFKSNGLI